MTLKKILLFSTLGWSHEEINWLKTFACLWWIRMGSCVLSEFCLNIGTLFIIASGLSSWYVSSWEKSGPPTAMFLTAYSSICMWVSRHFPFYFGDRVLLSFIPGWPTTCYVTQVSFRLLIILLSQPSVCWGYSHVSPCLGSHQFLASSLLDASSVFWLPIITANRSMFSKYAASKLWSPFSVLSFPFWQCWGLNSGPYTCWACTLSSLVIYIVSACHFYSYLTQ